MEFTKNKGKSLAAVLIVLIIFNIIAFVAPFVRGAGFWTGYAFIVIAALLSAGISLYAFEYEGIKSKFYGFPIAYISWIYFIAQLIAGLVEMTASAIPFGYGIIMNAILLGACLVGSIGADIGREELERIDIMIEEKVFYIKSLQDDVEEMAIRAQDTELKRALRNLAETIRYSDPMSSPQLSAVEEQIERKVSELCSSSEQEISSAKSMCDELLRLFADRNRKVKLLK